MADDAPDDAPRVIGEFSDYDEMISALRARAAELNLSGETIDEISGLPSRYAAKLLGPQQIRRLGALSLGCFFGALAVRGVLVEDRTALEKLRSKTTPRNSSYVRSAPSIVFTVRFFKRIGRLGAQARVDNSTKAQRREWARHAAIARWRKDTA
jgi:hypothetical protein